MSQGWTLSDPVTGPTAAGASVLSGDEIRAWDSFAAAMISNITDRTMGADVAAALAATIADAMIMERRRRPRAMPAPASAPAAPAAAPAPPARALVSEVRAATGSPVMPSAADAVATPAASAASDPACECGHVTGTHVREAPGVDRFLRCVVPHCDCVGFQAAAVVTPGAAGL